MILHINNNYLKIWDALLVLAMNIYTNMMKNKPFLKCNNLLLVSITSLFKASKYTQLLMRMNQTPVLNFYY